MRNVPDDWDMHWRRCEFCGQRYHASEGGCGCTDDLDECPCGECDWTREVDAFGRPAAVYCSACGGRPGEEEGDE